MPRSRTSRPPPSTMRSPLARRKALCWAHAGLAVNRANATSCALRDAVMVIGLSSKIPRGPGNALWLTSSTNADIIVCEDLFTYVFGGLHERTRQTAGRICQLTTEG